MPTPAQAGPAPDPQERQPTRPYVRCIVHTKFTFTDVS
jgi:hypothetical protein